MSLESLEQEQINYQHDLECLKRMNVDTSSLLP